MPARRRDVLEFITFMERETGRIQLDLLNPSWIIFGQGFRRDGVRLFTSRALDFIASGLLLAMASPIMLLTMLAIWLEDGRKGGGVFYRQARVGYEGRIFQLTKFRSMHVDAECRRRAVGPAQRPPDHPGRRVHPQARASTNCRSCSMCSKDTWGSWGRVPSVRSSSWSWRRRFPSMPIATA